MHHGSCLCGAVRYRVDGALGPIALCHCSRCRKASGSAFGAVAPIRADDFTLLSGADALRDYESSPGVWRVFCGTCGSPIYGKRAAQPDLLRLRIGTLDSPAGSDISAHIFVGSKAEWFTIHDDIPQYQERP